MNNDEDFSSCCRVVLLKSILQYKTDVLICSICVGSWSLSHSVAKPGYLTRDLLAHFGKHRQGAPGTSPNCSIVFLIFAKHTLVREIWWLLEFVVSLVLL